MTTVRRNPGHLPGRRGEGVVSRDEADPSWSPRGRPMGAGAAQRGGAQGVPRLEEPDRRASRSGA
ncbi:hypothetical protein AS200_01465 [Streptomyces sp. CdTB01]|nr:hypothetical protein AS200_01465 [Streptomyces sp. CdTB01]